MIVGAPLGLLALAGIPALVALHLWRARHAPHPVSGLFLWPADRRILATGRRRAPLVLRPSFWLEILAVLAVAWWLADIHWSPRESARHLVFVLDDRWRMQAQAPDGTTCAQRLAAAIDARLAALAPGDRATLVASGSPPRLVAGPAASPAEARAALARWRPTAAWHDLEPAITLATSLAGAGAEITLGSDRIPERLPAGMGALATGIAATTSGLADARWWRDADGERIVALVRGDRAGQRRLHLVHAGTDLAAVDIAIDPSRPVLHVFDHLQRLPEGAAVELVLDGADPLPIDDRAALLRPAARTVHARIAIDGPVASAARSALAAAGAEVVTTAQAELTIGGGGGPWSLLFAPGDGAPTLGPFTAERSHPLLQDVDFTGVLWSGSAPPQHSPLLITGDRTLLSWATGPQLTLHLDPARSNLFQANAWPVLIANLVAWRAAQIPGLADPDPRCGQALRAMLPAGEREAVLRGPDGAERRLRADPDGAVAMPGLPLPGRWELRTASAAWAISALPLDARQADLAAARSGGVAAQAVGRGEVGRLRGPLAALLPLVLAAAAGIGAWAAFRREEGA